MSGAMPGGSPYGIAPTQGYQPNARPPPYGGPGAPPPYNSNPYPGAGAPYPNAPPGGYPGAYPPPYPGASSNPGAPPSYNSNPYSSSGQPSPYGSASPIAQPPRSGSNVSFGYPTVQKVQFQFQRRDQDKYANLYSVIAAAEALYQEKMDDTVKADDFKKEIKDLRNRFNVITQVLKMGKEQVEAFCDAVDLPCSFALLALYSEHDDEPTRSSKLTFSEMAELGSYIVEIDDFISLNRPSSEIRTKWDRTIATYKKTPFLTVNKEMHEKCEKNSKILKEMNPTQHLNPDYAQTLQIDCKLMFEEFKRFQDSQ